MADPRQDALEQLRAAVKAAGGPSEVARKAGMPISHLGNVLSGVRSLGRETAGKLRPHVELDAECWLDLVAPVPDSEAVEATA